MDGDGKTATAAGILLIIATAAPILTVPFIGFLGGGVLGEPNSDYLAIVAAKKIQVFVGMFIELVWALAVVGIPVTLFSVLKKYSRSLALWFYSLRFTEALSTIVSSIILLTLLTLGQEFVRAGSPDPSYYQTLGDMLSAAREWAFVIGSGFIWSLSALLLNYILYRSRIIPRWLSGWGLLGGLFSFLAYVLQLSNIRLNILFLPIAVQEMVFAVWLIVKGFNFRQLEEMSAVPN